MGCAMICFAMAAFNVALFVSNIGGLAAPFSAAAAVFCFGTGLAIAANARK